MAVNYTLAADAAVVLDYKGTNQAVVKGLNKISLPGAERTVLSFEEFRNEFAREFTGAGKYNEITGGGNYVLGDTLGQDAMRDGWLTRKVYVGKDMLCYLNTTDFFTTDLANDPSSGIQVASVASGEAGKNDAFPLTFKLVPNGRLAIYNAHTTEGAVPTTAFVSAATKTITDSASRFVTAGFQVGQTLLIIGSTSNDGVAALITNVAAGVLTLDIKVGTLTAEAGKIGMELHGGRF